jgi:hypothetical protein
MARKVVAYDSFKGGEFGNLGAWRAPKDSFTATNMLVYRTGELGVRTGLKERTPTGVATGLVRGFGNTPVPTKDAWFAIGNNVYTFDILAGNNLLTATGTTAGSATSVFDSANVATDVYLTAKGKTNSYKLQVNTGAGIAAAITTLSGSPSGRTITSYGDRLVIGDITGSLENRIRFSDAADYNSWPSDNFVDVGDGWLITGLYAQRQHLAITKQNGYFVLHGVPGVNDVLRKVVSDLGPLGALEASLGYNDQLNIWPIAGLSPAMFNGATLQRATHLAGHMTLGGTGDVFPPSNGVASVHDTGHCAVFLEKTDNKAIALINGVYTYHTFGANISGFTSKIYGSADLVAICDGGGASSSAKFYVWDTHQDRPGLESGTNDRAGDASSTALEGSVSFPEWWAQDASDVYVRAVIVDFRKWNTGSSTTNHFDLTVNALRRYQAGAAQASTTVSFDEAASSSSTSGTLERRIFGFGEQGRGNGFQLAFAACRGIAIQRIEVILDSEPGRF